MRCIHPVSRVYRDVMGVSHSYSCPCGHCIACLHNFQDSWCIRLSETCFAFKNFIYDTLTFRPESLPLADFTDVIVGNESKIPTAYWRHIDRYISVDSDTGEMRYTLPFVEKSLIQNWVKRGRERYFLDNGVRLDMKYFIIEEFGPKYSRPHFHCIFWGVSQPDYIKYFQQPWQFDFGFTKTDFILGGTDKSRDCISRYVSKYVSKGVFESPLVKLGLLEKPFRLISKGIGEEYLNRSVFDYFRSPAAVFAKSICFDRSILRDCGVASLSDSWRSVSKRGYSYLTTLQNRIVGGLLDGWLASPSDSVLRSLSVYYDRLGFPHSLPRYYRQKLLGLFKPNYLSYAIQSLLLACARVQSNSNLQAFALRLGYRIKPEAVESSTAGFGRRVFRLLSDKFALEQARTARLAAQRCYTKLKNHYGRSMNLAFVN